MPKHERSVYTPTDFLQWRNSRMLDCTPRFQRRSVWKAAARSFFIDTILREMPVPPIYLRVVHKPLSNRIVREVVDGQQRIAAVLDFIDGHFRLSGTLDPNWRRKSFKDLTTDEQKRILTFSFSAEIFSAISDAEVLGVFARLNTYSVPLNAQELRNGKYFGYFKQSAYALAHDHLELWRRHKVFTDQRIARMLEVEFTSELMIAQLAGMQDKKKSINDFYEEYDDAFTNKSRVEERFRRTIDTIGDAMDDELSQTEFRRPPLFYTLFCAICHRMYGLPKVRIGTPKRKLSNTEKASLQEAVVQLSDKISRGKAGDPISRPYESFVKACLRQTDNIRPRQVRLDFLYRAAF